MNDPTEDPRDRTTPSASDADRAREDDRQTGRARGRDREQSAPSAAELASQVAARSAVQRTDDGRIDVLSSIGGVQGLAESIAPGLVFTVLFTFTRDLGTSLVAALVVAAVFTVVRLVSRTPVTQAIAGLIGVAFCAFVAQRTGNAEDFFLPGFYINGAYIIAMSVSVFLRWPFAGLIFGFIRNEGIDWRKDRVRVRAYSLATWIIVGVLALRLVVQVPLYLAENVAALGSTRVAMGLPLYALGLWLAWLVSRPRPTGASPDPQVSGGTDRERRDGG